MRSLIRRSLWLELVAGFIIMLAMSSLAQTLNTPPTVATHTTVTAQNVTRDGQGQTIVSVVVTSENGQHATGAVALSEDGNPLAGIVLNPHGKGSTTLSLSAGNHYLQASYLGDATHIASASQLSGVYARPVSADRPVAAANVFIFTPTVAPATMTLKAGQSGTAIVSIASQYSATLAAPRFVTLSCSDLPDRANCSFTPATVEILPNSDATVLTSNMVITTQSSSGAGTTASASGSHSGTIAWAFLLPGVFGLGGFAWAARRRNRWLSQLSLLAILGLVSAVAMTGCNSRYNYFNHGPDANRPTPSGSYQVTITAQSSDGVTAITQNTTLALTVNAGTY